MPKTSLAPPPPHTASRVTAALAALAITAVGVVAASPTPSHAAEPVAVAAASLQWGVKSSFVSYVTGPIAEGAQTLLGNTTGGSPLTWPTATGTIETGTSVSVNFGAANGVRYTGHTNPETGVSELDLTLTHPRVIFDTPTTGRLILDIASRAPEGTPRAGESQQLRDVHFADLTAAPPTVADRTTTWADATTTLTTAGEAAFGGSYSAGTQLDPLTLSVQATKPVAPVAEPTTSTTAPTVPAETAAQAGQTGDAQPCLVPTASSLTWGVRESFRTYIAGPIAHGSIVTHGNVTATAQGPFLWTSGAGATNPNGTETNIEFGTDNGVQFLGHDLGNNTGHALNLTFRNPRVEFTSSSNATLFLNVTGREFVGASAIGPEYVETNVPFATLTLPEPAVTGATRTWNSAAAVLTEAGAHAFGGFYTAGTQLDPVSLSVTAGTQAAPCHTGPLAVNPGTPVQPDTGTVVTPVPVPTAAPGAPVTVVPASQPSGTPAAHTPTKAADTCVARSVSSGSAEWQLKESFRNYIAGPIAHGAFSGGSFTVTGGAINVQNGNTGVIRTTGTITATGHDGLLNFSLSDPEFTFTGASTALMSAVVSSTDMHGTPIPSSGKRVDFANVAAGSLQVNGAQLSLTGAAVTLTAAGAEAFAGFYKAGTELDPLTLTAQLGGNVPCDKSTQKAGGSLATTGSTAAIAPIAAASAAALILFGAALLYTRSRRKNHNSLPQHETCE